MSLSRCIAARGEVEADNVTSVACMRVYFATPRDNDSEAAAAVDTGTLVEAVVEVAVEAAVEAAVDKRQVAVRNPVDSAADTAGGVAVHNSGVGNPADYIAPAVRIPAVGVPAGVRLEYGLQSPARQKVNP